MKPLELTIYPKMGSVYYDDEANCTWSETMVYGLSVEKRLTDAELAAETYKGEAEFRAAAGYGYSAGIIRECDRKRSIVERFATLPHYDEAQEEDKA